MANVYRKINTDLVAATVNTAYTVPDNSRALIGFNVAREIEKPVPCAMPSPPTNPKIKVSESSYA